MVCLSVCWSVTTVIHAKTAETIVMPFGMRTWVGQRNHVQIHTRKWAILKAKRGRPGHARSCQVVDILKAPQYLQAYCEPMSTRSSRRLRSVSSSLLAVPRTRTNYGDRSFAVYGPRVWNSLPDELRSSDITLTTFRNKP